MSVNAASLGALPVELKTHVVSYLNDQASIWSMTMVSKSFHNVAEPFLYHTIENPNLAKHYRGPQRAFGPWVRSLVHTIVTKPHLAAKVKVLRLGNWLEDNPNPNPHNLGGFTDFMNAGMKMGAHEDDEHWPRGLVQDFEAADARLLFYLLPNIELLELSTGTGEEIPHCHFLSNFVRRLGYEGKMPLTKLNRVEINRQPGSEHSCSAKIREITPLFELPSVTELRVVGASGERHYEDYLPFRHPWRYSVPSSAITMLELPEANLDFRGFSKLLRPITGLRHLDLTVTTALLRRRPPTPTEIMTALAPYHLTLEHLCIQTERCPTYSNRPQHFLPFIALKWLGIEQGILFGHEPSEEHKVDDSEAPLSALLPSSLESLTLYHCDGWTKLRVKVLAVDAAVALPNLKEVSLTENDLTGEQLVEEARETFRGTGVGVERVESPSKN